MKTIETEKTPFPQKKKQKSKSKLMDRLRKRARKIQAQYERMKLLPKLFITIIPFIFVILAIAWITWSVLIAVPNVSTLRIKKDFLAGYEEDSKSIHTLDSIEDPKTEESPLNGIRLTKKEYEEMTEYPPTAVMVENLNAARPQSGLDQADLVYETLAEGGITRFMPIYWSQSPNKVGPIRSSRTYFIDWLSPYNPIYMHIGQAASSDPEVDALGALYNYNIRTVQWQNIHWRSTDRPSPHNAYASIESTQEAAENLGYDEYESFESWNFKSDAPISERGKMKSVEIKYFKSNSYGMDCDVTYVYDKESNSYKRSHGETPHIDKENEVQLAPKVVIVQETVYEPTYDSKSRILMHVIGSGDAKIFMDGKVINAQWNKENRLSRTEYTNVANNKAIEFNRGQIWIMAVPKTTSSVNISN